MHKKTVKGFILGLSTAVILGSATLTVGAATSGKFKDVKAMAWYENAVLWAQEKGIVSGYPDGTFKPNSNVTRAELTGVVQNLAKEGYLNSDIPLDGYEKYEAIQVGKTTLKDLENTLGKFSPVGGSPEYNGYYVLSTKDMDITVTSIDKNVIDGKRYSPSKSTIKHYPQVTKQNLEKLENGMSYEQVSAILGGKGSLERDTTTYKAYSWYGTDKTTNGTPYDTSGRFEFKKIGDGLSLNLQIVEPAATEGK
ncbi:S-layer homology domain-containing protein [Peribacillus loiseleuriae]|uniref:SLH domain-containing protein n=1 Tax=Peribacillus loiseleuriae TaxID=1679170 RepID=A0A0K9G4E1_9BACI|nr:S-layer homology domain-containing protein [Peribacillus loiseleuriae]KMY41478.1 hypothetical protein AC625_24650 [Peribacillus loiseleuriae]